MSKLKSIVNKNKILIKIFISSFFLVFLGFIFFKKVRNFFPVPEISETKIDGFSQFFGYPLYFDTLFFSFIFLIPVLVCIIFYLKKNEIIFK